MKNYFKNYFFKGLIFLSFGLLFFFSSASTASANQCYCEGEEEAQCFNRSPENCAEIPESDKRYGRCTYAKSANECVGFVNAFNEKKAKINAELKKNEGLIGKFIPGCVDIKSGDAFLKSECADVTIFITLMFNIITYLFSIIGGVALLFFVYGGFVFILSQGNSEKVSHGKSIITAAVLGIIVAFSGYALVQFVGEMVGIEKQYQLTVE